MLIKKPGMTNTLKDFFNFQINSQYIEWNSKYVYFLRIRPKNMTILSYTEKLVELKKFQNFLDSSGASFSIFVTDKTENLDDISEYYKAQLNLRPEYAFVLEPIINKISSIEQSSACVQRAFYIVFKATDQKEFDIFAKQLSGRLDYILAEKEELVTVMRNYILREYTPFDLYVFETALKEQYQQFSANEKKHRKVKENPFRESREDNLVAIDKLTSNNIVEVKHIETASNTDEHIWGHS